MKTSKQFSACHWMAVVKRKISHLILLGSLFSLSFSGQLRAQNNPCYVVTGVTFTWDSLNATPPIITFDDQFSPMIPIGFPFCFFGNYYSHVVIGSNGVLSFNTTNAGAQCPWAIWAPLPDSTPVPIRNSILFPWHDNYPPMGGTIKYQLMGTAPFRKFVVQFQNMPMFQCPTTFFSGEVILFETINAIETHLLNKQLCPGWNNGRAIHGLVNANGTSAVIIGGRNCPVQWTAANEGVRFTPVCGCPNQLGPNTISGKVYRDNNSNCIPEISDWGMPNTFVRLDPGALYYSTDAQGNYEMHIDTGNFTVTQIIPSYYLQQCPTGSYSVSFPTSPLTYPNADFADSLRNCHDVSVGVTSGNQRVCRSNNLYFQCCNYSGITANNVILTIYLPDSTYLVSPLNYIANPAQNVYQYSIGTLLPNQCTTLLVHDSVDCAVMLGSILCFGATITADSTDCNTENNADEECKPAVNSYDPNDKEVASQNFSVNGYVLQENITASDTLTYSIHFQNTGNDVAYNVTIIDSISSYLDPGTIEVIGASHQCQLILNGHTAIFSFSNIMLPDSNANEPLSHGFVKFRLRQQPGNQAVAFIYNSASIYFDINPPVVTNQALNIIPQWQSVPEITAGEVQVFPNPATSQFTIHSGTIGIKKIEVHDFLGQSVFESDNKQMKYEIKINSSRWKQGIYFITITDEKNNSVTKKIVKM